MLAGGAFLRKVRLDTFFTFLPHQSQDLPCSSPLFWVPTSPQHNPINPQLPGVSCCVLVNLSNAAPLDSG